MFTDCVYDATGHVVCTYRGLPFQCTENETPEEWRSLQAAIDTGDVVVGPYCPPPVGPPPTPEELAMVERVWRNGALAATDGVVIRHRDEMESGGPTTLTPEQYSELQQYRQALRNWPESGEFPLIDHRPLAPPWLAENL